MSGLRARVSPRLTAFFHGIDERTPTCPTNTQFLLQLSGYHWVAREFGPLRGQRVLDAASGTGFGSMALAREGARVVGIDLNSRVVASARRGNGHAHLTFLSMDVSALGFRDETFDLVISQDTLEHVEDDARFVGEVHRALKERGAFVVFTPHAVLHTTRPANPYHLREYSPDSLGKLLRPFFPATRLYGRRPGPRIREVEARLDQVRWLDPLGFRRLLLPVHLRHRLAGWGLRRLGSSSLQELYPGQIEYFEGCEGSGTLIAVCRKRDS